MQLLVRNTLGLARRSGSMMQRRTLISQSVKSGPPTNRISFAVRYITLNYYMLFIHSFCSEALLSSILRSSSVLKIAFYFRKRLLTLPSWLQHLWRLPPGSWCTSRTTRAPIRSNTMSSSSLICVPYPSLDTVHLSV